MLRSYCGVVSTTTIPTLTMYRFTSILFAVLMALAFIPGTVLAQDAEEEKIDLAEYQGSYEGRDVQLADGVLTYFRTGMQNSVELGYLGDDRFEIVIPPGAVVQAQGGHSIPEFQFNRDEDGKIVSLSFYEPTGELMATHPKTKDLRSVEEESNIQ